MSLPTRFFSWKSRDATTHATPERSRIPRNRAMGHAEPWTRESRHNPPSAVVPGLALAPCGIRAAARRSLPASKQTAPASTSSDDQDTQCTPPRQVNPPCGDSRRTDWRAGENHRPNRRSLTRSPVAGSTHSSHCGNRAPPGNHAPPSGEERPEQQDRQPPPRAAMQCGRQPLDSIFPFSRCLLTCHPWLSVVT